MDRIIFWNGKFIPEKYVRVFVLGEGFLYGWGIFETMRSYHHNILYFKKHIERSRQSSRFLNIQFIYPAAKIESIIRKLVELNCLYDAYIRLTLWKEGSRSHLLVVAKPYHPYSPQKYRSGFSVCIAQYRQNENLALARIKSNNRLLYELAYGQARQNNCDEALILNNRGYIAEGSRSNVFLVKDKELFTPGLGCGCLEGITRKVVFDIALKARIKVNEGDFTVQDLSGADEAFLTNSLMGVMPLTSLGHKPIGKKKCGRITGLLIRKYSCLLK